jgi:hypothetical protein
MKAANDDGPALCPPEAPATFFRSCQVSVGEQLGLFRNLGGDRPKGGGSGGWAKRASSPALSDSIVSLEGAVRCSGSNL